MILDLYGRGKGNLTLAIVLVEREDRKFGRRVKGSMEEEIENSRSGSNWRI